MASPLIVLDAAVSQRTTLAAERLDPSIAISGEPAYFVDSPSMNTVLVICGSGEPSLIVWTPVSGIANLMTSELESLSTWVIAQRSEPMLVSSFVSVTVYVVSSSRASSRSSENRFRPRAKNYGFSNA